MSSVPIEIRKILERYSANSRTLEEVLRSAEDSDLSVGELVNQAQCIPESNWSDLIDFLMLELERHPQYVPYCDGLIDFTLVDRLSFDDKNNILGFSASQGDSKEKRYFFPLRKYHSSPEELSLRSIKKGSLRSEDVTAIKARLGVQGMATSEFKNDALFEALIGYWKEKYQLKGPNTFVRVAQQLDRPEDVNLLSSSLTPEMVRYVNSLIERGIAQGASDIHFSKDENGPYVRYRLHGKLTSPLPLQEDKDYRAVVSRIKVMAKLNIAETQMIQDGKFILQTGEGRYDIRVSVLPNTLYGEKLTLRLLDQSFIRNVTLSDLGMSETVIANYKALLNLPHGLVLVTGPTGSGKSTTLYSGLKYLLRNRPDENILTIEDPIEYTLPGVVQTQVNPAKNYLFSTALRGFLRSDPDIIMLGEIRDVETAKAALNAALTGHLVLSTIHTNSAPGTVVRLNEMEVDSFLIHQGLRGVLAQRLVPKLCPECREPLTVSDPVLVQQFADIGREPFAYAARGCSKCYKGIVGRTGLCEVLPLIDGIDSQRLFDENYLKGVMRERNLPTLRSYGLELAAKGIVPLSAVVLSTL